MYRNIKVSGILIIAMGVAGVFFFSNWSAAQDVTETVDVTKLAKNIVEVQCIAQVVINSDIQATGPCTFVSPRNLSTNTIFTVPVGNAFVITTVDIRVDRAANIFLLQTLPPQQPAHRARWDIDTVKTSQLQFRSGIVIPPGAQLSVTEFGAIFAVLSLYGYLTPATLCRDPRLDFC